PGSVEAYYQEIGRAGRDGRMSRAVLLFHPSDRGIQQFFIDGAHPPAEWVHAVYDWIAERALLEHTHQVFDKIKADLAKALFTLPAVLGVEYGIGFGCVTMRGSENNDVFVPGSDDAAGSIQTTTNRHGGMLGGITSGEPIVLRAAVKPTSSLPKEQPTVTTAGKATTISTKGRHDPCLLPRFIPMAEAMVAIVLADHWLRWRAQCSDAQATS
ncbi:MAG: chorismate synthase, partial [Planctomycetaceae bacterium]